MSMPYSGYRANERPIRFWLDAQLDEKNVTEVYEIEAVEDCWYDPNAEYFRVRTIDGKRYLLRFNERDDEWTLLNSLDGTELLARPEIELVSVESTTIRVFQRQLVHQENLRP